MKQSLAIAYNMKRKKKMTSGGHSADMDDAHDGDIVDRIMSKRKMYSEGGRVANGGDNDVDEMADSSPNNFDDLALRDDLESSSDGSNSGDFLGNSQESEDRQDIVDRIMKSRAKKDRMPRPA